MGEEETSRIPGNGDEVGVYNKWGDAFDLAKCLRTSPKQGQEPSLKRTTLLVRTTPA